MVTFLGFLGNDPIFNKRCIKIETTLVTKIKQDELAIRKIKQSTKNIKFKKFKKGRGN